MGLFGRFKERCPTCMKEFKVEEEYNQHIETLHPVEKQCTKCGGLMVIPKFHGIRMWREGWQTNWDPEVAIGLGCTKCGFIEFYMTDPKGEFYRD
ncbi:hypothetical protein OAJ86_01795 [Nitrosopumilus sp.]|nr:hypothetical protein [Nitrosopumilus sp.]